MKGAAMGGKKTIAIKQEHESRETALTREGWVRQSTLSEPRLSEVAANYRAMGYEVLIENYRSQDGCNTCFDAGDAMGQVYGTVFVRKGEGSRGDDDLF